MNIYPRLTDAGAELVISELLQRLNNNQPAWEADSYQGRVHYPSTAGSPVTQSRLMTLRDRMTSALETIPAKSRNADRRFDVVVGKVLDDWFDEEGRNTAARLDVWPFLTLCVLPDFALRRFPPATDGSIQLSRFKSGRRNVFYRAYLRSWILGPLINDPEARLYEDELVGLVDRSMSADHRVARRVAFNLAQLDETTASRRTVSRDSFKELQFELRVTDLASLPDDAMFAIVDGIFERNRARVAIE